MAGDYRTAEVDTDRCKDCPAEVPEDWEDAGWHALTKGRLWVAWVCPEDWAAEGYADDAAGSAEDAGLGGPAGDGVGAYDHYRRVGGPSR